MSIFNNKKSKPAEDEPVEDEPTFTCACGCGTEVKKEGGFAQGHYLKWKAQQKKQLEEESKEEEPVPETPPTPPVEEPEPTSSIDVLSVQEFHPIDNKVAWFLVDGVPTLELLEYVGIIQDKISGNKTASLLMMTPDGLFSPLFSIPGFMGIYPDTQEFTLNETSLDTESEKIPNENVDSSLDKKNTEPSTKKPAQETINLIKELANELP